MPYGLFASLKGYIMMLSTNAYLRMLADVIGVFRTAKLMREQGYSLQDTLNILVLKK